MAKIIDDKKIFSLLEVTTSIQKTLSLRYTSSFWVKAEMNKLNYYPYSGHCYPDLVEKIDGKVVAQLNSTLWKDDYVRINDNFLSILKTPLKDGIKMLFCARITFDPLHGLALRITDIDPVFSLGELEREKQECITSLKKEGVFNRNRTIPFPLLPKRLAIISVQTSKGFADFSKMIDDNPWGYKFSHVLFPSILQGDKAIESIRYQLSRIRKAVDHFDVVAIIRGGGGDVGLSCFNDFKLSREIALFPLPVITGIGHATNETVVEMVAFRNAITPTELADFLLQKFHDFSFPLQKAEEILVDRANRIITEERQKFMHTMKYFRSVTGNLLIRGDYDIQRCARELFKQSNLSLLRRKQLNSSLLNKLSSVSRTFGEHHRQEINRNVFVMRRDIVSFFKQENASASNMVRTVSNLHPMNVLKRGYTITRINGKSITSAEQVNPADKLETILANGALYSEVTSTEKSSSL